MKTVSSYVISVAGKEQILLDWNEIAERYGISFSYYSFNRLFLLFLFLFQALINNFLSLCIDLMTESTLKKYPYHIY